MSKDFKWAYVGKTPWTIEYNHKGEGLLLCVPRGIPCEGHTQVFSAHTTNTPEWQDVEEVLKNRDDELTRSISAFCEFAYKLHSISKFKVGSPEISRIRNWPLNESIAALFAVDLINSIAKEAEHISNEKFDSRRKVELFQQNDRL